MAILSKLYKRDNRWCFHIIDYDENIDSYLDTETLDKCVRWTTEHLESYPRVVRMAYDMWYFERKLEAERFQSLWMLRFSA